MPSLGGPELLIVLVLVIIVFGVGKLPEVGGALGKSIKEFRKASDEPEAKPTESATATGAESVRPTEPATATDAARQAEIDREVERRLREREASHKE